LRPLLAGRWIEKTGNPAPVDFNALLTAVRPDLTDTLVGAVRELLQAKRRVSELGKAERIKIIDDFILAELHRHTCTHVRPAGTMIEIAHLNYLFRGTLFDTFGSEFTVPQNLGKVF
jgi:predicted nucleotidyltransferase